MALAPEWMTYTKDDATAPSRGARILGRERMEKGSPKYGKQLCSNNISYHNSYAQDLTVHTVPFACSVSPPPAPPQPPPILGNHSSRVLNRSKSSPGFGSQKSKQRKFTDRFPNFKPAKMNKPLSPSSYAKSHSQPNLFNNDKAVHWHQQKLQQSNFTPAPSPLANSYTNTNVPPSTPSVPSAVSAPLPPSASPPPAVVPEIDKLKQLVPTAPMPPRSVRSRGVVGPPLPMTKKPPPTAQPSPNSPVAVPSNVQSSLAVYFRKASSEPSLIHHKPGVDAAQARRAEKKVRAAEYEKAHSQLLKEVGTAKQPKRSNFFQNIIKQEERGVSLDVEVQVSESQATPYAPTNARSPPSPSPIPSPSTTPSPTSSPTPSPRHGLRSPLPEDMEDEERFLRTLGWVPDEEDPVPVLEEEEIADVRVKIFLSKTKHVRPEKEVHAIASIDADVK